MVSEKDESAIQFTYIRDRERVTRRRTKHPYLKPYTTLFCKFYKITLHVIYLFYVTVIMATDFEIKVLVTD